MTEATDIHFSADKDVYLRSEEGGGLSGRTARCAGPTAGPAAGPAGRPQTSGGSSPRRSSRSRGSGGRSAGCSVYTSGSAWLSLAAARDEKQEHRAVIYRPVPS